MSTDRVNSRLRLVKNEATETGDQTARRVRRLQREADRVHELEAELVRERQVRIRVECVAQRYGVPGWEIQNARHGRDGAA